jgi:hypothetical protein
LLLLLLLLLQALLMLVQNCLQVLLLRLLLQHKHLMLQKTVTFWHTCTSHTIPSHPNPSITCSSWSWGELYSPPPARPSFMASSDGAIPRLALQRS